MEILIEWALFKKQAKFAP